MSLHRELPFMLSYELQSVAIMLNCQFVKLNLLSWLAPPIAQQICIHIFAEL